MIIVIIYVLYKGESYMKKILIETSARHIHLSEKDLKILCGEDATLEVRGPLSQPGQFSTTTRLTIVGAKRNIERVTVLGPTRKDTQVEVSLTDDSPGRGEFSTSLRRPAGWSTGAFTESSVNKLKPVWAD